MSIETTTCGSATVGGTGFAVAPNFVLTAATVVAGSQSIQVTNDSGIATDGTVVGFDGFDDVALVQTDVPLSGHQFTLDLVAPPTGAAVSEMAIPSSTPALVSGTVDAQNAPDVVLGVRRPAMLRVKVDEAEPDQLVGAVVVDGSGNTAGVVLGSGTAAPDRTYVVPSRTFAPKVRQWMAAPAPLPTASCVALDGQTEQAVEDAQRYATDLAAQNWSDARALDAGLEPTSRLVADYRGMRSATIEYVGGDASSLQVASVAYEMGHDNSLRTTVYCFNFEIGLGVPPSVKPIPPSPSVTTVPGWVDPTTLDDRAQSCAVGE